MNAQDLDLLRQRIRAQCKQDLAAVDRFALLLHNAPLQPDPTTPAALTPRNDSPRRIRARTRGAQTARRVFPPAGPSRPGRNGDGPRARALKRLAAFRGMLSKQDGDFTDRGLLAQVPDEMPAFRDEIDLQWIQQALFRHKVSGMVEKVGESTQHGVIYRRCKSKESQWAELRESFNIPTAA